MVDECEHLRIKVSNNDEFGRCHCENCGKQMFLYEGLSLMLNRIDKALEKAKEITRRAHA